MNDSASKFSPKRLQALLATLLRRLSGYAVVLFLLLLVAVYGFVLYRISVLSSVQPSDADVTTQAKASAVPHVDSNAVKQLESLQDNSVSVRTLFNQTRNNPFQE